jgi:ribosomal protein S18 acetylase RimI-like enzyme
MDFEVRPVVEGDWEAYRDIRLEMLLDTPTAFTVRFATAEAYTEAEWRERAGRNTSENQLLAAAIAGDGTWVGSMGGYIDKAVGGPVLYGVYVSPEFRGRDAGVTDALLEAIEEWASANASTLRLEVHEDNARARAAYIKRGFVETGHRRPYDLDQSRDEIEMIKRLR